jgi:hypothetical protein
MGCAETKAQAEPAGGCGQPAPRLALAAALVVDPDVEGAIMVSVDRRLAAVRQL